MMLTYYCKQHISINKKQWPATSLVGIRKKHSVSAPASSILYGSLKHFRSNGLITLLESRHHFSITI